MDSRVYPFVSGLIVAAIALIISNAITPQDVYSVASVQCASPAAPPKLLAKAAYVYDSASDREIFSYNADSQLPLASLTKLMTVVTALKALDSDEQVVITKQALSPEGDSGLVEGEVWTARDLADFSLIESSNDGVHALMLATLKKLDTTEMDFFRAMNFEAERIGLTQTYFMNETGLDLSAVSAGAYGSARDMALLISALYRERPQLVERSSTQRTTFVLGTGPKHDAENTTAVSTFLSGVIASKTGFTDLAQGNMVVLFEPVAGKTVAIAVLGSTREGREDDTRLLAEYASEYIQRAMLCGRYP
jgi:D-alanyl-D-alanine carboxypeptidase (penicillin-binding protein 5/6)